MSDSLTTEQEYQYLIKKHKIPYIKNNQTTISLTLTTLIMIINTAIISFSNIYNLIISNLVNSNLFIDFIKYNCKRTICMQHWITNLFEGQTMPTFLLNNNSDDMVLKINSIYSESLDEYIAELKKNEDVKNEDVKNEDVKNEDVKKEDGKND